MHRSISKILVPIALALGVATGASAVCTRGEANPIDRYDLVISWDIAGATADPTFAYITVFNPNSVPVQVDFAEWQKERVDFMTCGRVYEGDAHPCGPVTLGALQTTTFNINIPSFGMVDVGDVIVTSGTGLAPCLVSADIYALDSRSGSPLVVVYDHAVLSRRACS